MAKAAGKGSVLKCCRHTLAVGDGWPVTEGLQRRHRPFGVFNLPEGSEGAFCTLELVGPSGQHKWVQFSSFPSSVYCGTFYICVIIFSHIFFLFFHSLHFILYSYFKK